MEVDWTWGSSENKWLGRVGLMAWLERPPLGFEQPVCLSELLPSFSAGYLGKSARFSAVSLQIPAHWTPG